MASSELMTALQGSWMPATNISEDRDVLLKWPCRQIPTYVEEPDLWGKEYKPLNFLQLHADELVSEFPDLPDIQLSGIDNDPKKWLFNRMDVIAAMIIGEPKKWDLPFSCFFYSADRLLERWLIEEHLFRQMTTDDYYALRAYTVSITKPLHSVSPRPWNVPIDSCLFTLDDIWDLEDVHRNKLFPSLREQDKPHKIDKLRCRDLARQWISEADRLLRPIDIIRRLEETEWGKSHPPRKLRSWIEDFELNRNPGAPPLAERKHRQ